MKPIVIQSKHYILSQLKTADDSIQRRDFGRQLYLLNIQGQLNWLKLQAIGCSALHEQSFLQEIKNYQDIAQILPEILPQFEMMDFAVEHCVMAASQLPLIKTGILIKDTDLLFDQDIELLSDETVFQKLILSLEVIEKLHGAGFVHGDLKQQHFRLADSRCVLIDFEQCFHTTSNRLIENTATPRYMAPELFHGQAKSFASDVYALGIIWLEWLNQMRFQEKTYLDWAKLHCQRLEVHLNPRFKCMEHVLMQFLQRNQLQRTLNFSKIKQILNNNVHKKSEK